MEQKLEEKKSIVKQIIELMGPQAAMMKKVWPTAGKVAELNLSTYIKYDQAKEKGQKVAWINFATPPELFWAMDILPVVYDGLSSNTSRLGYGQKYLDLAEQYVPDHVCGDNKIHLGIALSGEVPYPDILVYPSSPCDSNRSVLSAMAEYAHVPTFVIDLPYFKDERALQFLIEEQKRLISALEEVTGRKLDLDKLREVMKYSNLAHQYSLELDEYRKRVPSPFTSMEMYLDGGALIQYAGTPEMADYYKARLDEVKAKYASGQGLPKVKEKIRVTWAYGVYIADLGVFTWMEEKWGAVSINCMNFNWTVQPTEDLSSLDSILRGLGKKCWLMPMNREVHGPSSNFVDATLDLCRRYKADCSIVTGHVACKSNWAVYKIVKDKLEEELGIPFCVFEVDLFDPRLIDPAGVKGKLEDFFENIVIPGMKRKGKL